MHRLLPVAAILAVGTFVLVRYGILGAPAQPAPEAVATLAPITHRVDGTPLDLAPDEPRPTAAPSRPETPRPGELHRVPPRSIMSLERRHDLRSFRRELAAGITELESNLAACEPADATFQLEIETVSGGARILEASVTSPGSATPRALDCARAKLRGYTLGTPSAETGRRLSMPFSMRVAAQ
jgi:hypothetical protein